MIWNKNETVMPNPYILWNTSALEKNPTAELRIEPGTF
jgi:hypothetical protein